MIFYFSGLGNTKYVAKEIGAAIFETPRFIPDYLPEAVEDETTESVGFLFPIYSWGVPPIVLDFIKRIPEKLVNNWREKELPVWTVCTYGDETGGAIDILRKALKKRGLRLQGAWSVRMPNTYVLLPGFDVDPKEIEKEKLSEAKGRISEIARKIKDGCWEDDYHTGSFPALRTKLIFPLFVKYGINAKKWHHTNACVKCGRCIKACPVNNISMGETGPLWGEDCTSCLACFHNCPYHAVEYGKITKNKGQYVCPLK